MRKALILLTFFAVVGCSKTPALYPKEIETIIEQSDAFRAPMNPDVLITDTVWRPGPESRREFMKLLGVVVVTDGPVDFGSSTATVSFLWKWNDGPLAGYTVESKAKLTSASGAWKVYEDVLKRELWDSEREETQRD